MMDLEKSILSTIVYYDTLDLPITSWEIFEYLMFAHGDVKNIVIALDGENLRKFVEEKDGFYFLKGRGGIVGERLELQKVADRKWKKTLKIAKWFQVVPFVKGVYANGSLALNHTDKKSDLDIFIVSGIGRIWTVRFLLALLTTLMGVKRFKNSKKICDKICFNHFITDKSLYMSFQSIYTAHNYARLIPIYGADLRELFYEENEWMKKYLPNFNGKNKISQRTVKNSWLMVSGRIGEFILVTKIGNVLERILKKYQLNKIERGINDIGAGRIVACDTQLEFHPHSPERQVIDKYNNKMRELGFSESATEKDSGLTNAGCLTSRI